MLQTISDMLTDYPYVHVFALDFSKAFDTVQHSTLLQKLATLDLPDKAYNQLKDFLDATHTARSWLGQSHPLLTF
jgi:Reverse transcriptase (RNA-dependent DNA polymerase)